MIFDGMNVRFVARMQRRRKQCTNEQFKLMVMLHGNSYVFRGQQKKQQQHGIRQRLECILLHMCYYAPLARVHFKFKIQ